MDLISNIKKNVVMSSDLAGYPDLSSHIYQYKIRPLYMMQDLIQIILLKMGVVVYEKSGHQKNSKE